MARHTGFNQSSIVRWVEKLRMNNYGHTIPTESSRPHSHPSELSAEMVQAIIDYRLKYQRCAEVVHYFLERDGYCVSLSSVKRTLKRNEMTKYSKWKKWHQYGERPKAEKPGILVQIDTILDGPADEERLYIYTMLDVCSRWASAMPVLKIGTHASWEFIQYSQQDLPFEVKMIQSDHGAEFSKWLTKMLEANEIQHRHSRVRTPTDNAYVERFNRTIQQECLSRVPKTLEAYQKAIPDFLHYYNFERPHMGLNMLTPHQVMQSY